VTNQGISEGYRGCALTGTLGYIEFVDPPKVTAQGWSTTIFVYASEGAWSALDTLKKARGELTLAQANLPRFTFAVAVRWVDHDYFCRVVEESAEKRDVTDRLDRFDTVHP